MVDIFKRFEFNLVDILQQKSQKRIYPRSAVKLRWVKFAVSEKAYYVCDEIINDHYLDYLFFLIRSPILLQGTIQVQTALPLLILENYF
jgi:hypothetical protein